MTFVPEDATLCDGPEPDGARHWGMGIVYSEDVSCIKCGGIGWYIEPYHRPSREEVYLDICRSLRRRSTCKRGKVGCIAVMDRHIIAEGYNGSPEGAPHCFELGCIMETNEHKFGCQRTIHAEANLIAHAARFGTRLQGATLYSTHGPCYGCAKLIAATGFSSIVYEKPYRLPEGLKLLFDLNIPALQIGA